MMVLLDFENYIDKATISAPKGEFGKNFIRALEEVRNTGQVVAGLEDISSTTYTIQPLKILMNGNKLGIYVGKGETAEFGEEFSFVPLRVTKYRVIWSITDNRVVQRVFPRDVMIPEQEGKAIYPITAVFGITSDFRHFFVIEGIRTKIDPVNNLVDSLKANVKGKSGIYELLAHAKVITKRSGKIQYKTIDLSVIGELDKELIDLARLASSFVADYIEYRRKKPVQLISEPEEASAEISEEEKALEGF